MTATVSNALRTLRAVTLASLACLSTAAISQTSVTTYHNNKERTGLNSYESILTTSNVNPSTFGLLFTVPVDGYVYAQPLYLPGVTIPGKGTHNVVFVATEHNSVYAFDADSNAGANATPLWQVNLGPSVPYVDTGTGDIVPEVGITGTPVIVPALQNQAGAKPTLFVVAKTKTFDAGNNPVYANHLHALDVTTGAEKPGSPVLIQGTVPGTGEGADNTGHIVFNALIHHNRAGLLYLPTNSGMVPPPPPGPGISRPSKPIGKRSSVGGRVGVGGGGSIGAGGGGVGSNVTGPGTVYVAFASHGDSGPYHGWVFAFNAQTLQQTAIMNTTPNAKTDPSGYPIAAGGIWQGGAGIASDGYSIYCATGNGTFDPKTQAYGDAVIRLMTGDLSVADYFAPSNQQDLDNSDSDLGSGGVMLLPGGTGTPAIPNLMVQSGKEGSIFLLNRDNLGLFGATNTIVQELHDVMGGIFGSPAYYNSTIYFGPAGGAVQAFPIASAAFVGTGPSSSSPSTYGFPGTTPSISSNGLTNGILWALQTNGSGSGTPERLHAYVATDLTTELYNSDNTNGRDAFGASVKFNVPTVVNGKVYAGTQNSLAVFGLGLWAATPSITPADGNYNPSVTVTATDSTPNAQIYYTTDGSTPTQSSTLYNNPVTFTSNVTFKARAYATGYVPSGIVERNYQINATVGNGTGLLGSYWNNSQDPIGPPTATRLDPTINFTWDGASPIAGVGGENFYAQWAGKLQAEANTTYTFYTTSDDGVQVTLNGQVIIDNLTYHAPTVDQATVTLQRGVKYSILIKYFQGQGGATMQFAWSAPGMPKQIVPTSQLSPG